MDKREFSLFTMALRTYYPREKILPNEQAMALWFQQLSDIPYKAAEAVLNRWVANNKWSPSIADIREGYMALTEGETPDWGDAWEEVHRAIRHYGYYRSDEAMESLSPLTREAVKRIGFSHLCQSEQPDVERANFRMIYESLVVRKRKEQQIPPHLRLSAAEIGRLTDANISGSTQNFRDGSEA